MGLLRVLKIIFYILYGQNVGVEVDLGFLSNSVQSLYIVHKWFASPCTQTKAIWNVVKHVLISRTKRIHLTPVLRNLCAAMVDYCHMTFNKNWCSLYNNLSTWIFALIFALTPVSHNWGLIGEFIILKVGSFGIKHDVLLLNWHSIQHIKLVSVRCL